MKKRTISILLVLALLVQILPLSVFAEGENGEAAPAEVVETETEEPGLVVLGEMTDRRGESEKHFHLNNGNFVAVDYGVPVHYSEDEGATWEDIDNTLSLSRGDAELYIAENGDSVRGFASNLRDGRLLTVANGDYSLHMGLASDADNADRETRNLFASAEISYPDAKTRGNEELPFTEQITPAKLRADVLYRNVYDGVDLSYTLYSYNVKETIVLNQPRGSYSFPFAFDAEGLAPVLLEDGSIDLRTADGEVIYQIPAPYMYDADGTESDAVSYTLEEESGAWTLTVTADAEWINDEARVFPVSIDPTIYFAGDSSNEQIFSGYINDNSPNTHPSDSSSYIRCGNYQNSGDTAGHAIGLIYVNKLPSIPENCVVTTSMLKLFQTHYSNGNTGYYNYPRLYTSQIIDPTFSHSAAESFINSLTWNNLTNKVSYGGGSTPETRTTIDYTKCMITTLGNHYLEITDTTRQWYEGTTDISRLLVLDDGQRNVSINTRATFSGYGHESFGHQPQLIVLYRNTVGVEGIYDYHTQNIGRAGTASVNNFTMGLSLSVPVYSAPSQALPFGLTLTYNSALSNANFTSSSSVHTKAYTTSATGYGWKTSVQQTVDRVLLMGSDGTNRSWLIYTDADGTEHYFKRKNQTLDYEDEDGLGLTITVDDTDNPTIFTMKDKEKNTWTFLYGYLSSYVDNNGNALYYAYNGYDYSSSENESNWKPSDSSTVYRVTSVWRQNSGVNSATRLVVLNYSDPDHPNRLSSIEDMAERPTTFEYDTNEDLLTKISYPDGKTATYTYSDATVNDPQTGTTKTFHRLTTARDNEAEYEIRYTYWDAIAPRVKEIKEYSGAVGSETAGSIMRGYKPSATSTFFRYCGADNTLSTSDDIVVRYYFDHWGRSINVVTYDVNANSEPQSMLGISVGEYKQNKDTNKDNNRMTHAAASGMQSTNLVYNSGIEHLTNNAGDLYGWTASGNGSVTAKATSETTPVVTPRTGKYMMKLFLGSVSAGQESCYQTVYLTAGNTYVFSGYVNTASVSDTGTGGAYLSFRTSSGTDITDASSRILNYKTNTAVDNGWERLEAVFTPPEDGTYQVAVNLSHMANVVLADDLQLEKATNMGGIEGEASASSANLIQLSGFELPTSTGTSDDEVTKFWTFSMNNANTEYRVTVEEDSDQNRGKVIRLHNAPDRQVRAKQNVILNAPANRTYLVSAWGKLPVGYTSDGTDMKYNNETYKRFFGIIAKIYYVGYSTPEYQYIAFNCALGGWQYTSGMIVPEKTTRTVERIELNVAGELLPNDAYVDDVTLIQEPVQTYAYDANGNITATTNTEGQTSTEFDSKERLKKYTAMNEVVYNLTYEGDKRQPKTIVSDGITTTYNYDDAGNITNTKVQAPNNGLYLESGASYDSTMDFPAATTDTNGYISYTAYDPIKGLLDSSTDPNGITINYDYDEDNDRIASTYKDENDKAYLYYQYDLNGRLKQLNRKDYLGTATTRQGYHFVYDAWGNTTSIAVGSVSGDTSDSLSSSVTLASYVYNVNGTLARMNYPDGHYVTYTYDKLDRLIEEVYHNSDHSVQADYRYVYNANGQLARQYAVENNAGIETVTESYSFEYDSLGRLIRSREEGSSNLVQRTEHLYDQANRLTAQNWSIGDSGFSEQYEYDGNDGTMKKFTAGTGYSLNYSYDDLNRLNSVTTKKTGGAVLYARNYTYWDYDGENNRTTSRLKTFANTDANGNLINGNRYTYDANGNIIKIEEAYTANAYRDLAIYVYDELNQLDLETRYTYTNASAIPTTTTVVDYTIDTAGNLSSVSGGEHSISYTYSNQAWSDLLTGITVDEVSRTISYASAGNPSNWYNGSDYSNLVWEQGRRLSSITKHLSSGVRTYSYAYDMSGVRSSKSIEITVDGILRHRRYDYVTQNGKVVRETAYYTDGDGEFMHCLDFFYDENGNPFAMRKYSDETLSSYNTYYYVLNAQGDVVKLIAPSGNVYAEYSYDAWGNILDSSGSLRNTNPLRYRGYYYDKETGFYYLQSRYYDPIVKRFLNADSYGSTGQGFLGYNMFVYCGNNPIRRIDPSGHSWFCCVEEIHEMKEKAKEEEEEYKKEFLQKYYNTYGEAFDVGSANYFRVGKDKGGLSTFDAFAVNTMISVDVAICTCGVGEIFELGAGALIAISAGSGICTNAVSSFIIKPNEHDIFVVEAGFVNWELNPIYGWKGEFYGQLDIYKINDDGTLTRESSWFFRESAKDMGIEPPPLFSGPAIDL